MFDLEGLYILTVNIISIPFQLYQQFVYTILDFLAFDVLRWGQ